MVSLLLCGAGVAVATWVCIKMIGKKKTGRARGMSFNSQAMVDGAFPPECQQPPPIINSLLLFAECPSKELIIQNCQGFVEYQRSRCSPVLIGNQWVMKDVELNLNNHVSTVTVDSEDQIMGKLDDIMRTDLDGYGTKPLWHIVRIHNTGRGLSGILIRIHHVIGDGVALVECLRNMFQDASGNVLTVDLPERIRGEAGVSFLTKCWRFVAAVGQVLALPASAYDTDTSFTHEHRKQLVCRMRTYKTLLFPTYKLEFIKTLKNKGKCTINDVYMCAIAGAIRRYSLSQHDSVVQNPKADVLCRALMPIAFPRSKRELANKDSGLRNKWSFVSARLPVGVSTSAQDRLHACNTTTQALKKSPAALVQLWLQNTVMPHLPKFFNLKTAVDVFSRHSMILSNVPGPGKVVMYGPHKLLALQFFFPNLLPQYDVVSYNGAVFASIGIDASIIRHDDLLVTYFHEEIEELARAYGISTNSDEMLAPKSPGGAFGLASL